MNPVIPVCPALSPRNSGKNHCGHWPQTLQQAQTPQGITAQQALPHIIAGQKNLCNSIAKKWGQGSEEGGRLSWSSLGDQLQSHKLNGTIAPDPQRTRKSRALSCTGFAGIAKCHLWVGAIDNVPRECCDYLSANLASSVGKQNICYGVNFVLMLAVRFGRCYHILHQIQCRLSFVANIWTRTSLQQHSYYSHHVRIRRT